MSMDEHITDIGGVKVNTYTRAQFLDVLTQKLQVRNKIFITTLYSEFLYAAMKDKKIRDMLNTATFALPDGIAVPWAQTFLSVPLTKKSHFSKAIQGLWQLVYSGASILLNPTFIRKTIPENIVGADLIWDLSALAGHYHFSIYLLGGFNNTANIVADKLKKRFANITIVGASNKNPDDPSIVADINESKADFLFVAFGPIRQEQWIANHLPYLNIKLAIGLGGTFDYVAGTRKPPPSFIRDIGLEWLYRLLAQPHRAKRIWNGTWNLCKALLHYKVYSSYPYRKNVACVVINSKNQILICERIPRVAPGFPESVLEDARNH